MRMVCAFLGIFQRVKSRLTCWVSSSNTDSPLQHFADGDRFAWEEETQRDVSDTTGNQITTGTKTPERGVRPRTRTCASKVRPEWQRLSGLHRMNPGRISSSSMPFSLNFRFSPGNASSVSTSSLSRINTSTVCCDTDVLMSTFEINTSLTTEATAWPVMQRRSSHPVGHHDELLGFTDASGLQLAEDNCAHVLEGRKEGRKRTQEEGSLQLTVGSSILLTSTMRCLTPAVFASMACSRVCPPFSKPVSNSPFLAEIT
ncbi:hypothetical protein EYF80_053364 [Liparis tanakae]|uniref:Uncharacterized protein n=1 Tax=Liparis tanakae TaxID=230148 RepID=A0A4Z2F5N5_9TELE|nr:hypothetical protein EYF80_053364 [Liparis tanakae]